MTTKETMLEDLAKAQDSAAFTANELRDALAHAGAVEGAVILALIERAEILRRDIAALAGAVDQDMRGAS